MLSNGNDGYASDKAESHLGFNGTERPGAVYLAQPLGAHNQKGLPAFSIYGRDVQDIGDTEITADVEEKLLQFAKAGLAVATMKGTSYLSMGTVSMGIAGCIVDEGFFQKYLGMRNEYVDMTEFVRRIELEIYDHDEYERALSWIKENCKPGADVNPKHLKRTDEQKQRGLGDRREDGVDCPRFDGGESEAGGNGIRRGSARAKCAGTGFQGQRAWTDYFPTGDFMEAILNSSFDWNGLREPYMVATENDNLNGITMLFGHLLTDHGPGICGCSYILEPGSRKACNRVSA